MGNYGILQPPQGSNHFLHGTFGCRHFNRQTLMPHLVR